MSHDPPHGGPNLGEVPVETFSSVDYSYSGSDVAFFFIFAVFWFIFAIAGYVLTAFFFMKIFDKAGV